MPDNSLRVISAQTFSERLKAVLGDSYQMAFAEAVGLNLSTVYRWCSGDVAVPQYAIAIVEFLELLPKGFRPERWIKD